MAPPPVDVIEKLESRFGDGDYGFFSSANGEYGECPHCGLLFELPDPEVVNWLPFTDKVTFTSTVEELRRSAYSLNNAAAQHAYVAGNRSPL